MWIRKANGVFSAVLNEKSGAPKKGLAFSPDIIPQFGNNVQPPTLVQEYSSFVGLTLQPNDVNNIYIRGITPSDTNGDFDTAFALRAVPSELILWPQVWNAATAIGPGPINYLHNHHVVVAGAVPFKFRPSNLGGFNYALIASQSAMPTKLNGRLRENLQPLPKSIGNWRDYYAFLTTDTSTTYYNVLSAVFLTPCRDDLSLAVRAITTGKDANAINIIDDPFFFRNPPPPGSVNGGSSHYCLVSEVRHPTASNPDPNWPHEDIGDFATGADFENWVKTSPRVCWRNMTTLAQSDPATRTYTTVMSIPGDMWPSDTEWLLMVKASKSLENSDCRGPHVTTCSGFTNFHIFSGALTSSGVVIPGVNIGFVRVSSLLRWKAQNSQ
ncbi:hypothetical protein B0H11DRAFT_1877287 [Mycena galericulata]|nr:hypothetical protein B0H11DRAFT_1877287 [Mycena galericulata]